MPLITSRSFTVCSSLLAGLVFLSGDGCSSLRAAEVGSGVGNAPPASQRAQARRPVYDMYLLGPGDALRIELLDIPELSGSYTIGPDGVIYLPRLRALYVAGLTIEELRLFLSEKYSAYVLSPKIYIRPIAYRAARIYVGGEVRRPGYYVLSRNQRTPGVSVDADASLRDGLSSRADELNSAASSPGGLQALDGSTGEGVALGAFFPTLFDAIRAAQGITPYTNLGEIQVTRRLSISQGGGRVRAKVSLMDLIVNGDESQNIRLFDGDVISVAKSPTILRDQLLRAGQTNLNPQFIPVFISGRVRQPGTTSVPFGSTLNQALVASGGFQLLHGRVEFIRFTRQGELDRRVFSYSPLAAADDPRNPVLASGDIIRVQDSLLSAGVGLLNDAALPFLGVYSLYRIFN